jgi:hypothetical protein
MNPFIRFMASSTGRLVRIVAGVLLIFWGLVGLSGTTGVVVAIVGLVPVLAGVFDVCLFAPLFGAPFRGARIRAMAAAR